MGSIKMSDVEGIEIYQGGSDNSKISLSANNAYLEINALNEFKSNRIRLGTSDDYINANQDFRLTAGSSYLEFDKADSPNLKHIGSWVSDITSDYTLTAKTVNITSNGGATYLYAGTSDKPQKLEVGSKGGSYIQFNKDGTSRYYGGVTFKGEPTFEKNITVKKALTDGEVSVKLKDLFYAEEKDGVTTYRPLKDIIDENEFVTAAALTDLDSRLASTEGETLIIQEGLSNLTDTVDINYQSVLKNSDDIRTLQSIIMELQNTIEEIKPNKRTSRRITKWYDEWFAL